MHDEPMNAHPNQRRPTPLSRRLTVVPLQEHRGELRRHAHAIRAAWAALPDIAAMLRYENQLEAAPCSVLITQLRVVEAAVQQAATYAQDHQMGASFFVGRHTLLMLLDETDETLLQLVLVRETCHDRSMAALRVRQEALSQWSRMQTTLRKAVLLLDTDGQEPQGHRHDASATNERKENPYPCP